MFDTDSKGPVPYQMHSLCTPTMSSPLEHLKSSVQTSQVFDVDQHSGFMAPVPPISRLPAKWEAWEVILRAAICAKLQRGDKIGLTTSEASSSASWRSDVRKMPVLSIDGLEESPILLRRAHLVLAYILHFYVQSLPPSDPVSIPPSITLPILRLSNKLDLPPVLTFSDTVLYNWDYKSGPHIPNQTPNINNIRSQTTFTGLVDEEEFYLCSARIELRGVEILELMRMTMDETFVGDAIAVRRITGYLGAISNTIIELRKLLLEVKAKCNPDIYYNEVRPWFRGEDSDENKRKWSFEGLEQDPELHVPHELSGPSAGQSSMVHVLDVFLGIDHQSTSPGKPSFMARMQKYMPRNHRLFLDHLNANPRPLRAFVVDAKDQELLAAYNGAVSALKVFRDSHMTIVALYILGPARRAKLAAAALEDAASVNYGVPTTAPLKGTGGTELVKFLKDTRARTAETIIQS